MNTIKIITPLNMNVEYAAAGLPLRLAAYFFDTVIILVTGYGAYFVYLKVMAALSYLPEPVIFFLILSALLSFYHLLCEFFFNGQSIGKKMTGISVIRLDGCKLDFQSCALRWVFRIIDIQLSMGGIAVFCVLWTEKAQRLGDMVAGTSVVKIKSNLHYENTVGAILEDDYSVRFEGVRYLDDAAVTLIRDVLDFSDKTTDRMRARTLMSKTSARILSLMSDGSGEIQTSDGLEDAEFLKCIIKDYNKYFEKF